MRKMSAKLKLTLWTTALMLIMAGVLMALMLSLSENIILSNSKSQLSEVVAKNSKELEFDDGELDIDDIDFFKDGVYTLIYTQDGEYVSGNLPEEFIETPPFSDMEITEVTMDGTLYYIYDMLSEVEDYKYPMWVRGVIAVDAVANATNNILQIAFFSLPIIVLLGAFGSYIIAKKTFKPIDKIIKTAEEIRENEDLSLRIKLNNESVEIQKLSDTFDDMFERLEKSFETEKQFTADVSHELRTPTAVILAQCEYAIGEKISLEDKEDALETVQRQASKVSKLISNLLNLTRLDSGIEKAEFKQVDLSLLVEEVCEEQKLIAPLGVELKYDIAPNIIGTCDEAMITRLLGNLISNAFRYRKEDGIVEISLYKNEKDIVLSVKDNGIGISAEHQEKIWQRFYQVDGARTSNAHTNMGLGLAMVKQIARLHNAKVELESELGKGSQFKIILKNSEF